MRKYTLCVFVVVFLCLSLVIGVRVNADEVIAKSGSTPTIDGSIGAIEWADANYVSFNETTVYVKQDGVNLYIGFNISDATFFALDSAMIFIDVDHDQSVTLQPDDVAIVVLRNGTLLEANVTGGSWNMWIEVSGWTASVDDSGSVWQVEFSISYSKIDVTAGIPKTIGTAFAASDDGAYPSTWPPTSLSEPVDSSPARWGDMSSTGFDWVPEFSSFLILPLFIATASFVALYATFVHKRRLK